jgi:tRNA-dihydrouridine synthase
VAVHGRTAAQSYTGESDWSLIGRVADAVKIPVFGSGDCVEASQVVSRVSSSGVSGVLVGRGALRNPWIFKQAADAASGLPPASVSLAERGRFLLAYMELLLNERVHEGAGFRHTAPGQQAVGAPARGRERWVINKLRALGSWYTKGLEDGSRLRGATNSAESIAQLRRIIEDFFSSGAVEDREIQTVAAE